MSSKLLARPHAQSLHAGLLYRTLSQRAPSAQVIHILEVNPTHIRIEVNHAFESGMEREPVNAIAQRVGAVAAINGSNYRRGGTFNGNSVNILKINSTLITDPAIYRAALYWSPGIPARIEQLHTSAQLKIGAYNVPIDRINQPRAAHEAVLYTDAFHPTTLTDTLGAEITIADGHVVSVTPDKGNSPIVPTGLVLSIGPLHALDVNTLSVGMRAQLHYHSAPLTSGNHAKHSLPTFIVGGSGLLIKDGQIITDFNDDLLLGNPITHTPDEVVADFHDNTQRKNLINQRHPRTAVGLRADGTWVVVVVDGRAPKISEGMTFAELAQLMADLGCVDAINMGGGGCSTMYLDGQIVNTPCGNGTEPSGTPRPVAEAITFF